jgi:hypothetical protein
MKKTKMAQSYPAKALFLRATISDHLQFDTWLQQSLTFQAL